MIEEGVDTDTVYKDILDALRSDQYEQGSGALCQILDGTKKHCCVGVIDEVAFGTDWEPVENEINLLEDDQGETYTLSGTRAYLLNLDEGLTAEEADFLNGQYGIEVSTINERMEALTLLNDSAGLGFVAIADLLENKLGWFKHA